MRRALPTIAVSAAGLTWLLHSQHVIDVADPTTAAGAANDRAAGPSSPGSAGAGRTTTTIRTTPSTTGRTGSGGPSTPTTRTTPTTAPPAGGSAADGTVNGSTITTRFGPVQVAIVVSGGRITEATALQQPNRDRRSVSINARAVPQLDQQVVDAQTARIDGVSGATITSDAYAQSLQAALDAAGVGG